MLIFFLDTYTMSNKMHLYKRRIYGLKMFLVFLRNFQRIDNVNNNNNNNFNSFNNVVVNFKLLISDCVLKINYLEKQIYKLKKQKSKAKMITLKKRIYKYLFCYKN